jgi:hypothetical protein
MKTKKIYLGLILAGLGLAGMATMLTMDIPLPPEVEELMTASYTPEQIKLLILINPIIILAIAVVLGTILYNKVNLRVPIVEKLVGINHEPLQIGNIIKSGALGGIIAGIVVVLIVILVKPFMLDEYEKLAQSVQPSLANRLLYGGITEELYLRFGLMTLFVWIGSKIFKGTKPVVYWIGIVLAALLFAIGHFPVVYNSIEEPSFTVLSYVLMGNTVGGLIFGWLYWKKGLESAFIAHMFIHIVLVIADKTVI